MNQDAVVRIDARLAAIRHDHEVAIPLAIESGSRAWGFPSPDSDYDCRFIFVRPTKQYLSPWQRRDVIETELEGELDVSGWELGKAIKLLLKGNAVIAEWLTSPIVYSADREFRREFLELARRFLDRTRVAQHYIHLGEKQRRTYFGDSRNVPQKKIFYALRPAAALRWLRLNPEAAVAPMHFPTLLAESDVPAEVAHIVSDLIARKALTREMGSEPLPTPVAVFIDSEFDLARKAFSGPALRSNKEAQRAMGEFFIATVLRLSSREEVLLDGRVKPGHGDS
jgi:predicted nucleotidyltransferase